MNDDFLTQYRKAPSPQFAVSLHERLFKHMQTTSRFPVLRLKAVSAAILAALALAVFFFPPARVFAQGLLDQIGGYVFTQGPLPQPDPNRLPGPIRVVRVYGGSVSIQTLAGVPTAPDPAAAASLAGFDVLVPSYLPTGYTAMGGWYVTSDGGTVVTNGYRDTTNHFILINQWKVAAGATRTFAEDPQVIVSVRGQRGLWLPDTLGGEAQKNALVWDEHGITYSLITDSVPLAELLKVAESLEH